MVLQVCDAFAAASLAPSNVRVTPGDGKLGVIWEQPGEQDMPVVEYVVSYTVPSLYGHNQKFKICGFNGVDATHIDVTNTRTSYTITGLQNGQEYCVRVGARYAMTADYSDRHLATPSSGEQPLLVSANVVGAILRLTFDELIDTNSVPPASAFTVVAGGSTVAVSGVGIQGAEVTLTLATAASASDTVTLSYAVPTGTTARPLQDWLGNKAPALSSHAVVNSGSASSDATLSALTVSGATLTPTFFSASQQYRAVLPYSVTSVTVTPTPSHSNASVAFSPSVDADTTASGHQVPLGAGQNTLDIVVTAENTIDRKTYTVSLTRSQAPPEAPARINLSSRNDGTLRIRWSPPNRDGGSAVTGYKVQWTSDPNSWAAPNQAIVTEMTQVGVVHLWSYYITGLQNGTEYRVRVIAYNLLGDSEPSREITGTPISLDSYLRNFMEEEIVGKYGDTSPWLRTSWEHMKRNGKVFQIFESTLGSGFVQSLCTVRTDGLYTCRVTGAGFQESILDSSTSQKSKSLIHEMAHYYDRSSDLSGDSATLAAFRLYLASLPVSIGNNCRVAELYADVFLLSVLPDANTSYWDSCTNWNSARTTEALAVLRSSLSGTVPAWFYTTYGAVPDLERVWADIKNAGDSSDRYILTWQLRNAFGGYCSNSKAAESAFEDGVASNPWRDGGCVPGAPANVNAAPAGSGKLAVSWSAPASDGGSPIEGYRIQWKSDSQQYDTSRQSTVAHVAETHAHAIAGLTNGKEYSIRIVPYNQNGDGASTEVEATPSATDVTPPAFLEATVDGTALMLSWNEVLDSGSIPAAGTFSIAVGGTNRVVADVAMVGSTVALTLSTAVVAGEVVSVSYTVPTSPGAARIRDVSHNAAASLADIAVRNTTLPLSSDTGINWVLFGLSPNPQIIGARRQSSGDYEAIIAASWATSLAHLAVEPSHSGATVTFSPPTPAPGAFSLVGSRCNQPGDDCRVYEFKPSVGENLITVSVTAEDGVTTDSFTVSLTRDARPVAIEFAKAAYTVAEGGAISVTVRMDADPAREVTIPITATPLGGVSPLEYSSSSSVTFTSGGPLTQSVTVTASTDSETEQGEHVVLGFGSLPDGVELSGITTASVALQDEDSTPPALDSAAVSASTIVLTYDETLDSGSVPPASAFAVRVAGTARSVTAVSVSGATVVLQLSAAVAPSEPVGVSYTAPTVRTESKLRDTAHNDAAGFTNRSVPNHAVGAVCNRTDVVRDEMVRKIRKNCSEITVRDLAMLLRLEIFPPRGANITSLRADDFSGLSGLRSLSVNSRSRLMSLPKYLFYGLSKLETLILRSNNLSTLDSDVFSGLRALKNINLSNNRLSSLPDGIFSSQTLLEYLNLSGNTVDPLPIRIGLEAAGAGAFKATVHSGAPFRIELPVVVTNGELSDGSSAVVIPAGTMESTAIHVSRLPGTTAAVTVDIGTLPSLPSTSHSGYALVKSGSLPLEVATDAVTGTPEVSIASQSSPVNEGGAPVFTLTRTGSVASALTVNVEVSETGAMLQGTPASTVTFDANSATAELSVATEDDEVAESASVVTAALAAGSGYAMDSGASSATVTVEDDDAAPVVTTASPIVTPENGASIVTLTATDNDTPVADLAWSIAGGADAGAFALTAAGALSFSSAKDFEAPDDTDQDGDYEVTVRVTDGANPVEAPLTIRLADVDEVAPTVTDASVDGDTLTLTFSEVLAGSVPPASSAFSVTVGGTARGVSNVAMSASTVTLTLASAVVAGETVTVGYTAPTGANASPLEDAAGNAMAAFSDRAVTNATAAGNALPTGLPTIAGTARVGETLTASASAIADDDGLTNATFTWQWVANDGNSDADIAGATASTYTLTPAEAGKTVRVRVTFTDDGGTQESLVSEATRAVTGVLTARFESVPASHDGSSAFTLELAFTEAVFDGTEAFDKNQVIRGALEVTGGTLRGGRRVDPGAYDRWIFWIRPSGNGAVTVRLPSTTGACSEAGAICALDSTALSNAPLATVPGPASVAEVSISAGSSPVNEGGAPVFTLTRTGSVASALTVNVEVSETGAMLQGTPASTVTFDANSATAELSVATEDDEVAESASVVTAALAAGSGYAMDSGASSATVTVEDDDAAPVVTTASPIVTPENGASIVTLTATDNDTPVADLAWSIAGGADAGAFALTAAGALSFSSAKDFEAPDDTDQDGDYEVTVRVTDGANPVEAPLTIRLADVDEVAPTVTDASVDGDTLTLTFSEVLAGSVPPASSAFSVTVGGTARGVSNVAMSASTVTLTLASAVVAGETVTVGYTAPTGANASPLEDAAGNAMAAFSDRAVTNATAAGNALPTGLPTIAGTARVGETLTASASAIADDDGLTNATFTWQWVANDGNSDADIAGATASTYTLTPAEAGKTVRVRVTFTDDGGTQESLVSEATRAVTGVLTARFESVPASHDGSSAFTLELAFTEAVFDGTEAFDKNQVIRDALEVTGGTLRGGRRVDPGAYDRWIFWIRPSGNGAVTVRLPSTTGACSEAGAICALDSTALSNAPLATVPGPASVAEVSISAGSSPVNEGGAPVFTLTRTGSVASALTVNVEVSETGAMLQGTPASTVTFDANSATAELSVATEDDEVAESASVVTAALAAGSGYAMDSGASSATVTVEDDDAAPVVTTASPIVTPENGASIVTLTATDNDTPVADLAWSIAGGADAGAFALTAAGALSFSSAKDFEAPDDTDQDGDYEVTVRVTDGANPVEAPLTIRLADVDEVAPTVTDASVDGDTLTLTFSEVLAGSVPPASSAFSVTVGGTARGVSNVAMSASTVTLTLASAVVAGETVTVGYTAPTGANASPLEDAAGNAMAAFSDRAVTNATAAGNALPTGLPTIAGTARVGETLTASASAIADDDGLTNATFTWQWVANDGNSDADIAGATASTYTLTPAEAGKTVRVRVTFTDDGGTQESLVSEATAEVAALAVVSITAASSAVTEGEAASFSLSRTGDTAAGLTVSVTVSEAGSVLSGTRASTVTFAAGDAQATLSVATDDDGTAEADGRVTATVSAGTGYEVDAGAASAGVDVYDNDEAASTAAETLWTSTLTVFDLGGIITGLYEGLGGDLTPDGWTEDGRPFRAEQLYWYSGSSELAFGVSAWPPDSGELTLHVDDLQLRLSEVEGTRLFTWTVDDPGWQAGQTVAVKLTREDPEAAVDAGPGISVADAQVQEAEGAVLAFRVTLAEAETSAVSVRYATSDGTAQAGLDYVSVSGALRFEAGETAKTILVPVLNDDHDDDGETLTLTLSNPFGAEIADGTATGTIRNTDPIPKAWIARFGRTVAEQVIDAVEARMQTPRVPGTELSLAGQRVGGSAGPEGAVPTADAAQAGTGRSLAEWFGNGDDPERRQGLRSQTMTQRDFLLGSSFSFTGGTEREGTYALWGRGAVTRFDGREGDLSLDGEVTSGKLGADWSRDALMAGLVVSHSLGKGGYRGESVNGAVSSTLTGLYPWGRYALSERVSVWGVAGYGEGTLTLTPEGEAPIRTDLDLMMAAAGLRGVLVQAPETGGFELAVKTDAMGVRTSTAKAQGLEAEQAEVTRLRLGLEGSRPFRFEGGAILTPSMEIGVRHDGGDAETGSGVDIGGGLAWSDPRRGLSVELRGRGLVTHTADGFQQRGFASSLIWDPAPESDRGPSLILGQAVGAQATGGMEALLGPETVRSLGEGGAEDDLARRRLKAKLSYGFALFGGGFTGTPEFGLGFTESVREPVLGWRLAEARSTRLAFGLDVEAARSESVTGEEAPKHRLGLGFGWRLKGARDGAFELRFVGSRIEAAGDGGEPEHRLRVQLRARW